MNGFPKNRDKKYCKACACLLNDHFNRGEKNGYRLLLCPNCESVTVDPFPHDNPLKVFYREGKNAASGIAEKNRDIALASKRIKRLMRYADDGQRFLDVGCRSGSTVAAALRMGLDAQGIDMDADAIQRAQASFGTDHFQAINIQDYASEGHCFDVIYTREVIEHIPVPDAFVGALAKTLKPDGLLYLETLDGNHFSVRSRFTEWDAVTPPEHMVYFSRKGMRIMLEQHGFQVIQFFFNIKPGLRLIARRLST